MEVIKTNKESNTKITGSVMERETRMEKKREQN